jgi:hypothetical protein
MTKTSVGIAVLLFAALAVPGVWVLAGGDDDAPTQDDRNTVRFEDVDASNDDRPRNGDRQRDSERRRDRSRDRNRARDDDQPMTDDAPNEDAHHTHPLGRTIKLTFTIIGDDEEPSFVVLCARRDFQISHEVSEPDFEHALNITGQLQPLDAEGRVFIDFEAMTHHNNLNEGFDGVFRSEGSAILKLDKKTTLAHLGDEPLTVTATVEE